MNGTFLACETMIFCIFGGGKYRPRWGVQRGLPLALLGNFQRYVVLRLGKFPNKLRYFLRKYPAACLRSVHIFSAPRFVPTVCACRTRFADCTERPEMRLPLLRPLQPDTPYYFFPSVGGGAVVSVFKGSFAGGGRMQGFPAKYARSEARGRFIGKRRSRPTF